MVLACHALRALDSRCRLRTRRRVCICIGSTRCRGNHMHDHSRFQRDIDDVTGVSLSLYYSQKSLTYNIGSASALPIINFVISEKNFEVFTFKQVKPSQREGQQKNRDNYGGRKKNPPALFSKQACGWMRVNISASPLSIWRQNVWTCLRLPSLYFHQCSYIMPASRCADCD